MADPFAADVKWWKNRAAEFDRKRAAIRPISFDFVSKSYSNSGNGNGASTFNSAKAGTSDFNKARAKLLAEDADLRSRLVYTPKVKPGTTPTHNSVLAPSADVMKLDAQNDKTENKIKELGGNAFRSVVGGLVRVADVISRFGYAARGSALSYAKENAADGKTTVAEHFENFLRPVFDSITMPGRAVYNAATGHSDASYHAMWEGFTGREKVWGHDLTKVIFPEFSTNHKKWTSVLGFGLDVAYDPLSWVTVGQGTVVTGGLKGATAVGAKALGKGKLADDLLANTVWTATGRRGGIEAVRDGIYTRAAKPAVKREAKATKAVGKLDRKTDRAVNKGKIEKAQVYESRAQKAEAIRKRVSAETAAEIAAIHQESYTGMRLAWKAVARKSLGLGSITEFGKGVNTAGTSGRNARAFMNMQKASHDEIKARFKNPDSPEAPAWRAGHQDLIDAGGDARVITYGHGGTTKTFTVADDYDQFVDDFVDEGFRMRGLSEVTKKDRKGRLGMINIDKRQGLEFFNAYMEHLKKYSPRGGRDMVKLAGGAGKPAQYASRLRLLSDKTALRDEVVKVREEAATAVHDPALSPAQNQMNAANAAEVAKKAEAVKAARDARVAAEANHADATVLATKAAEAERAAVAAHAAAETLRVQAEADEVAIQSAVDEVLNAMGNAQASLETNVVTHTAGLSNAQTTLDQLTGVSPVAAMIRDQMSAKGQAVFDEAVVGLQRGLSDKSIHPDIVVDEAGQVGGIEGLTQGLPNKEISMHSRQINYRVAKAVQEVYDHVRTRLIAEELENDAELAFDALNQNTAYILNNLFGDVHMQTLVHLNNEHAMSVMAAAPEIPYVISSMLGRNIDDLVPLARALDPADKTPWGPSAVRNMDGTDWHYFPKTLREAKERLEAAILQTIDNMHHEGIVKLFGRDARTDLDLMYVQYNALVEAEKGVANAESQLGRELLAAVRKTMVSNKTAHRLVNGQEMTAEEILEEFAQIAATLNASNHATDSIALGHYSLYDYWVYGSNVAKETDPAFGVDIPQSATAYLAAGGQSKTGIGRAGYLGTAAKAKAALEDRSIVNEALNSIPAMDATVLSIVGHVKGMIIADNYGLSGATMDAIKPIISQMLMGDLQKLMARLPDGSVNWEKVNPAAALGTLGTHVLLLSDTNNFLNTVDQINLAKVVWGNPVVIDKLNQSILLYNLHMVLNERLGPEAAAKRIAEKLEVNPEVAALMQKAAREGVTNGSAGRKMPVGTDPAVVQQQAKEAADKAIVEWEAKNPPPAAAPRAAAVEVGKPQVQGKDYGKYVEEPVTNHVLVDKIDTLTYHQAEDIGYLPRINIHTVDGDELKVFRVGDSGVYVVKRKNNSGNGTSLYLVRETGLKAFHDAKGDLDKVNKDQYHRIQIPAKSFDGEENDIVIGDVMSSLVAKNAGRAEAAGNPAEAAAAREAWVKARQAEHDRLTAVEVERLNAAAQTTPTPPTAAPSGLHAKLSQELGKQKQVAEQARINESAAATIAADAKVRKDNALTTQKAAADEVTTTEKALKDAEAIDVSVATATTTGGAPGGHATPVFSQAQIAKIDALIMELTKDVDILGINESVKSAELHMNQAFADYDAMIRENVGNMGLSTRYMLKFGGLPIMPLARSTKNPVAAYAGVVAMKESQGRVANWLTTRAWYEVYDKKFLRPTSRHNALMEDMRRALANNAQNRLIATHKAVKVTYSAFKNRAALNAAVRAFWDDSIKDVPEGLKPVTDRFLGLENEIKARSARATGLDLAERKVSWSPTQETAYQKALLENAKLTNNTLPAPYKVPADIFEGENAFTGGGADPWSRDWLIALSKRLNADNATHPLAAKNIGKLDFRAFDYAAQHGLSRVQLNTTLHDSMFAHFTFKYDADMIEVLNKNAPAGQKYVQVKTKYPSLAKIYGDVGDRWASEDMLLEMNKISQFMLDQNRGWGSDLNFRTFERVNNYWKAVVTTWNIPRYHIGNAMSDAFLSAMDGTGVVAYRKASTVMAHSHELRRKIGQDPEAYNSFLRPDLNFKDINNERDIATALKEIGDPKRALHISTIRVKGATRTLSSEDFYKAYLDFGLAQTQVNGNLLRSSSGKFSRMSNVTDGVLDLSNAREDFFRMAHFIHAVESEAKIPGRNLQEIFKSARDRVVKYHFDYGDVSEIERTTVGKYMPFYKWTRNIVPLAVTQMITNPKTYIVNNGLNKAMGEAMFPTQEEADGTEIPVSYITPSWVGDANSIPIGHYTDPEGNEQARYAVLNLPLDQALANWIMPFVNPFFDSSMSGKQQLGKGITNTASSFLAAGHPLLKAGAQAANLKVAVPGDSYDAKEFEWFKTLASPALPFLGPYMQWKKDTEKGVADSGAWTADNFWGAIRETANTEASAKGTLREQGDRLQGQFKATSEEWIKQFYPELKPGSEEAKKAVHDHLVGRGVLER
jgi:hypothetical protein